MIKIKLKGNFSLREEDCFNCSTEKLLSIDCWMTIEINDKILYDDWVCPLEFYSQLKNWIKEKGLMLKKSFNYISDDNSENPILAFVWSADKGCWIINSCLKKCTEVNTFSDIELYDFFNQFENAIYMHIK